MLKGTVEERQKRFLAAYSACKSLTQAARWAKMTRECHYRWLHEDETYPSRFAEAEKRATRALEDEAVRRAHQGLRKAVYHRGKVVGYETEYSDRLMELLLKAGDPEKYRDRIDQRHSGPEGKPLVSLDALRDWMKSAPPEGD